MPSRSAACAGTLALCMANSRGAQEDWRRLGLCASRPIDCYTGTKILGVCHCSAPRVADLIGVEAYLIGINTLEIL